MGRHARGRAVIRWLGALGRRSDSSENIVALERVASCSRLFGPFFVVCGTRQRFSVPDYLVVIWFRLAVAGVHTLVG